MEDIIITDEAVQRGLAKEAALLGDDPIIQNMAQEAVEAMDEHPELPRLWDAYKNSPEDRAVIIRQAYLVYRGRGGDADVCLGTPALAVTGLALAINETR